MGTQGSKQWNGSNTEYIEGAVEDIEDAVEDIEGAVEDIEGAVEDIEGTVEDIEGAVEDIEGAVEDIEGAVGHSVEKSKHEILRSNLKDDIKHTDTELKQELISSRLDSVVRHMVEELKQEIFESNGNDKEHNIEELKQQEILNNPEDAANCSVEESKEEVGSNSMDYGEFEIGKSKSIIEQSNPVTGSNINESNLNMQNDLNQGTCTKLKCMTECIGPDVHSLIKHNSEFSSDCKGTVGMSKISERQEQILIDNLVCAIDQESSSIIDKNVKRIEIETEKNVHINKEMMSQTFDKNILENDTCLVSKSPPVKKIKKKRIRSKKDLQRDVSNITSLLNNTKLCIKSTNEFGHQSFKWPADLALEYLSKISSVLDQISTTNIHLDDLNDLQNTTSYLVRQIKDVEDIHLSNASGAGVNQKHDLLNKTDPTLLQCLSEKYRFLDIQTTTAFYCTLCKIVINEALKNNFNEIHTHMKSDLHTQRENDTEQIRHSECRQDTLVAASKYESEEYKSQNDCLKNERKDLKKENSTDSLEKETLEGTHLHNDLNSLELSLPTKNFKTSTNNTANPVKRNEKINYDADIIKTHESFLKVILEPHYSKEETSQNQECVSRRGFYCGLCNIYNFYNSNVKGHHREHVKERTITNCDMFVCDTCNVELYGFSGILQMHNKSPSHKIIKIEILKRNNSGKESDSASGIGLSENNKLMVKAEEGLLPNQADSSVVNTEKIRTENIMENEDSENHAISTTNENQIIGNEGLPHNAINSDENHKDLMKYVAKTYLHISPRPKLPDIIAYYCETCKTTIIDVNEWDAHINAEEHLERSSCFALHNCDVCRVKFLSSIDYFENHLQSVSHHAFASKIKPDEALLQVEERYDSESDDESTSSSSNETERDESTEVENKNKTPQKKKKKNNKRIGLIVKGYPAKTKVKTFYKLFYDMGIRLRYVQMNYKKMSDSALVMFLNATDAKTVLERKEPFIIRGVTVSITECLSNKKDKFEVSANLSKLFYSPAILMGVIDKLIYRYTIIAKKESKKTDQLLNDIEQSLPRFAVYPFGSRMYGTTSGSSDLDVFVDIDDTYFDNSMIENTKREDRNIRMIASDFKRCTKFTDIVAIFARVPIVRLVHCNTGLVCDISCKNGLSVENTQLTKCYLESDPRVPWLVTAVKYWANINKLKDSSKFTSYALTWMVLYFLMQLKDPVVFPVDSLRKLNHESKPKITGWDCEFCTDVKLYPKTKNKQLVIELLHDFFVFYATLDHEDHVLCPIIGSAIPADNFRKLKLPACFQTYVTKFRINHEHIKLSKPLCLQDPLDLGHNVTKSVKIDCLNFFKQLCVKSARMCEEW